MVKKRTPLGVEALTHDEARRRHIPTAQCQSVMKKEEEAPIRVAGPFTVESLSPHRVLGVDEDDNLIHALTEAKGGHGDAWDFAGMILRTSRPPAFSRPTGKTGSSSRRSFPGRAA